MILQRFETKSYDLGPLDTLQSTEVKIQNIIWKVGTWYVHIKVHSVNIDSCSIVKSLIDFSQELCVVPLVLDPVEHFLSTAGTIPIARVAKMVQKESQNLNKVL